MYIYICIYIYLYIYILYVYVYVWVYSCECIYTPALVHILLRQFLRGRVDLKTQATVQCCCVASQYEVQPNRDLSVGDVLNVSTTCHGGHV